MTLPPEIRNLNLYYGMNVSATLFLEPLDQLDGFLVAKYLQLQAPSKFYPFVAGAYSIFNAATPEEALLTKKEKARADSMKKGLLEIIMENFCLSGKVYITSDLWQDIEYWKIFEEVVSRLEYNEVKKHIRSQRGMPMVVFPVEALGAMCGVVNEKVLKGWSSEALYIPAEVAEAVWFKRTLDVSFKTGPAESERIYDDIIKTYGIGVIGMDQPECIEKVRVDGFVSGTISTIRKTVPYIGRKNQERILFSDTLGDVALLRGTCASNPSFKRALALAELYACLEKRREYKSPARKIYDIITLGRKQ